MSWLSYWVFTPALFVTAIGETDLTALSLGSLLSSLVIPLTLSAGLALGLGRLARADGPQVTSLVQGSVRINTYVGLIFASVLHGQDGIATLALASAVVVPTVNLICVSTLATYGSNVNGRAKVSLGKELLTNPLILACIVVFFLNISSVTLPEFAMLTLDILAQPALACGTLIAGAALQFTFRKRIFSMSPLRRCSNS